MNKEKKSKLIEYKNIYVVILPDECHIICMGSDGKWDDSYNYKYNYYSYTYNYYNCNYYSYNYNYYSYKYNYYQADISNFEPIFTK